MSPPGRLRVLVADDQVVAVRGAVHYLKALGFEVCGTVDDPRRLLHEYRVTKPDVVVVESSLGGRGAGLAEIAALITACPQALVLVLTSDLTPAVVELALEHGCQGITPKTCSVDALGIAVRTVAAGDRYLHPRAISALLQSRFPNEVNRNARSLSPRELSVLACAAEGLTNAEIGVELGIAADTVKTHLARLQDKLGARDRTQAVSRALRMGLFP